jgi:hypothetical protein
MGLKKYVILYRLISKWGFLSLKLHSKVRAKKPDVLGSP